MFTDSELWSLEMAVQTRIDFCDRTRLEFSDSSPVGASPAFMALWEGQRADATALLRRVHEELDCLDDSDMDTGD